MELIEFDGADGVAQLGEHAASADWCELERVADGDEAAFVSLDEVDEAARQQTKAFLALEMQA